MRILQPVWDRVSLSAPEQGVPGWPVLSAAARLQVTGGASGTAALRARAAHSLWGQTRIHVNTDQTLKTHLL